MNGNNELPVGRNGRRLYPNLGYLAGVYPDLRGRVSPPAQLAIGGPQAAGAASNGPFAIPQVAFGAPMGWPGYYGPPMGPAYGMMPQHPQGFMQPGIMPPAFPPAPPAPAHHGARALPAPARGNIFPSVFVFVRWLIFMAADPPNRLTISVPINTEVAGAVQSRSEFSVPTDIEFGDLFDRCCARMNLTAAGASLGYKYPTVDKVTQPAHRYSNEEEHRGAIEKGIALMTRARSRVIVLEIHNLVSVMFLPVCSYQIV
jgi:hypothetical protein